MLTKREAKQRVALVGGRIQWRSEWQEYRCTLDCWKGDRVEAQAYYTDDLEDAMLTTLAMARREHNGEKA